MRWYLITWRRRTMHQPIAAEPTDPEPDTTLAAHYEAECRRRMAEIAAIPNRGFDSHRARQHLIKKLDMALDAYNRCTQADAR